MTSFMSIKFTCILPKKKKKSILVSLLNRKIINYNNDIKTLLLINLNPKIRTLKIREGIRPENLKFSSMYAATRFGIIIIFPTVS